MSRADKSHKRKIGRAVFLAVIVLVATLLIVVIALPSLPGMYDRARVAELIEKLEHYQAKQGSYPEKLEQLDVTLTFCNEGPRGMDYRPYGERSEFSLSCFGRGPFIFSGAWEIYSSETKNWMNLSM